MSAKYALVIGNSEYNDPKLAQLAAPGKDAEDLAHVLADKDLCAFDQVKVVVNQAEPVVREAIDEFFDQKMTHDLLLLYFSGHGVRDELGTLYLAVKNTNRAHLRSTAIKSDFIQEAMEQSRSKRQILVLDCCNSGAFSPGTKAAMGQSVGTASLFGSGFGRVVLTASDSTQFAWEGDKIIGETQNSLFTHYLVEGLKGEAEVNSRGYITIDALYDYAYEKVKAATPNQTPSKFSNKQVGELVLRQITRMQDIRAVALSEPLMESLENPLSAIRLGAVQELARLLTSKNLGLVRSAREALERIAVEDDSHTVQRAAAAALEPIHQAEQKAEEERLAAERQEAERLAQDTANQTQLALERLVAERQTAQAAERERLATERLQAERQAQEELERKRRAQEQAEIERKAKDEQARAAMERASHAAAPREAAAQATSQVTKPAIWEALLPALLPRERRAAIIAAAFVLTSLLAVVVVDARVSSTQKSVARSTNTAIARATSAAVGASTGTALAKVAAASTAKMQSTRTAAAAATSLAKIQFTRTAVAAATAQSRESYVANLQAVTSKVYGPSSAKLSHASNKYIQLYYTNLRVANFIAEATFVNPYAASEHPWDFGFIFRDQYALKSYRLFVLSNGEWNLYDGDGTTLLKKGSVPNLITTENGSNRIRLICQGSKGILYVNGAFVGDLDLSRRLSTGDLSIGTGFWDGDVLIGKYTEFKDFTVWKLP